MRRTEQLKLRSIIKEEIEKLAENDPPAQLTGTDAIKTLAKELGEDPAKLASAVQTGLAGKPNTNQKDILINTFLNILKKDPSEMGDILTLLKRVKEKPEAEKPAGKNESYSRDEQSLTERWSRLAGLLK